MKRALLALLVFTFLIGLYGCEKENITEQATLVESECKNNPLSESCYAPSYDLDLISSEAPEFLIEETFEIEFLNQTPSNWLMYKNQQYSANSVVAKVVNFEGNKIVELFSDGLYAPPFPQGSAYRESLIFTTKFNLDQSRAGSMTGKIMVPSVDNNEVSLGLSTGAVNTASIIITKERMLRVKIGGPFFYHSGNGDSGNYIETNIQLNADVFYQFTFNWDANSNQLEVILNGETDTVLYSGGFHISSRYNATATGYLFPPNVVRVTMPQRFRTSGFAYIDDIIVTRKAA